MDTPLKIDEVAQQLRVDVRTVYRYIKRGRLPATKLPGRWSIRQSALSAMVKSEPWQPLRRNDYAES